MDRSSASSIKILSSAAVTKRELGRTPWCDMDQTRLAKLPQEYWQLGKKPNNTSSRASNLCVCFGEVGGAKDTVEQAVFVKTANFCRPLGLVCKCHGKGGGAGQQTLSAASQEVSLECRAATCHGFRKGTTTRLL